jgi:hypothetical protein
MNKNTEALSENKYEILIEWKKDNILKEKIFL